MRELSADGKSVLFVGTKKQAQDSVKEEALRAGAYYVNARWLGGMLTNFTTIKRRIQRLNQLRTMESDGTFDLLPKKEVIKLNLEIEKLEKFKNLYSTEFQKTINKIVEFMKTDKNYNIHNMNSEIKE